MKNSNNIIKIEPPFDNEYDLGYIITESNNRVYIKLRPINTQKYSKRMMYARYIVGVKLNRILNDFEKVIHIDNDLTNNDIKNLKIHVFGDNPISPEESKLIPIENITNKKLQPIIACCDYCHKTYTRKTKTERGRNFCCIAHQHKFYMKTATYFNKPISKYKEEKLNKNNI